ncbi:MAG: UDP-glucose dehydrogenase family protein [Bryobacteraceae bacterium]
MRVSVAGLWHLGTVTAACCAHGGHDVTAFDEDSSLIEELQKGRLPVDEPGLAELTASEIQSGRLHFTGDTSALAKSEVLWICHDTPVDENDTADVEFVCWRVRKLLPYLPAQALVLISSQLPVGSTAKLKAMRPELTFAYSPENLRLGKAIEVFTKPDRVVVGVPNGRDRVRLSLLFAPFTQRIEWMSVESAEMTKHALNAFLATSVTFINEVAAICEKTGADAQEVERGLKSDIRIGNGAYLHPGSAFAGGTLARDISFLVDLGKNHGIPTDLLKGVKESNSAHNLWARRRLLEIFGQLQGKEIAILGLTYKPGTNTLRRSTSIEMCRWLVAQGSLVRAFDPAIRELCGDLQGVQLAASGELALEGAHAVLIATPWPEFRSIPAQAFAQGMRRPVVLDPARHMESVLKSERQIEYFAIGVSR